MSDHRVSPIIEESGGWALPMAIAALAVVGLVMLLLTGERGGSDGARTAGRAPETSGRNVHPPVPPTQISPDGITPPPRPRINP
jgi:hypothetical protein